MRWMWMLVVMLSITACEKQEQQAKPVAEVFVTPAQLQPYYPHASFNARIQSRSDVEIKAQVSGKLIAVHFREGDHIEVGAKLFDIDPAPFRAAMRKAEADLAKAKATESNAVRNYQRGKALVKDGYVSGAELDNLESKRQEAIAAREAAEAALERAKVDLQYTSILAPQSGRVGRSIRAVGDIVGPESGVLTTLVGQDDMDVVLQLPEALLLSVRLGEPKHPSVEDVDVTLTLPNGSVYGEHGMLTYFSNRVDQSTGTVEVRARIPNPDDILRPGMFARVTLSLKAPVTALMVPQAAVQVDQRGTYLLAVTEAEEVTRKNIQTGERVQEDVVVSSGLDQGTQVIMRGLQKVRPGDKVKALLYQPATAPEAGEIP